MRTEVTEHGINIPKSLLKGVKEVEIRENENYILIIPVHDEDPISRFGKNPVGDGNIDASVNHDKYIYGK